MTALAPWNCSRWWSIAVFGLSLFTLMGVVPEFQPLYAADEEGGGGETNIVMHIIKSAGWVFGPLLLIVSLTLTALIVLLALDLRMSNAIPPGFVDEFTDTVNKRKFKEAFDMARADNSFLGKVLTAGMSRLQYGLEDARDAAANMLDSIRSDKDQKNAYTAVIGTLGPMLGLVGTVFGMILAFIELGKPGSTPNPAKLADGISHALVVTLLGIGLSVPAIFFNAFFKNRIIRVTMETSHIADDLLTQMYHNSKKPATPTPGPGMPASNPNVAMPPGVAERAVPPQQSPR